uniref:P-type domain-containing protein n=2 Tax=Ciona intestinalis TaxID=7719 RepID=H2Y3D4_CIOIN
MYPWSGAWNDVDCLNARGYVCKKSKELSKCAQVDPENRIECGYLSIEESLCLRRGCCYDPIYSNSNFSGCYYPYGTDEPITSNPPTNQSGGLSAGAIVGIIIGVLALIVIGGGVFYMMRSKNTKEISLPAMPTWASTKSKPDEKAGFDNPVVVINEEVSIPDSQI